MANDTELSIGHLRSAVAALVRARMQFEGRAAVISRNVRVNLSTLVESFRGVGEQALAEQAAINAQLVPQKFPDLLHTAVVGFDSETHRILDLLVRSHGQAGLGEFRRTDTTRLGKGRDASRFVGRFAQRYVEAIISDADNWISMSKEAAVAEVPMISREDIATATGEIVGAVAQENRDTARALLSMAGSHAVAFHGHQIPGVALQARTAWARPPDLGARDCDAHLRSTRWKINDEGRVIATGNGESTMMSCKFANPQAFAKSLDALFSEAAASPFGGLGAFLESKAYEGRAMVEIPYSRIGLAEGDAIGYRAAGVRGSEAHEDWKLAREAAMEADDTAAPPAPIRLFDPIHAHPNGSVHFTFLKIMGRDQWLLVTMHP